MELSSIDKNSETYKVLQISSENIHMFTLIVLDINREVVENKNTFKILLDITFKKQYYLCCFSKNKITRIVKKFQNNFRIKDILKIILKSGEDSIGLICRNNSKISDSIIIKDFKLLKYEKNITSYFSQDILKLSNYLDIIYYINMKERPNRRAHIIKQLIKMKIPKNLVTYIRAVSLPNNPQIGCAMSHMKALSHAASNNFNSILILEDDFTFNVNCDSFREKLCLLNDNFPNWQVCMLSSVNSKTTPTKIKGIHKVVKADTTAGYLVRKDVIKYIFNIFYQCTKPKINYCANQSAIDVAWQVLQNKMEWYIFSPNIGYQSEEFTSDIEMYRTKIS